MLKTVFAPQFCGPIWLRNQFGPLFWDQFCGPIFVRNQFGPQNIEKQREARVQHPDKELSLMGFFKVDPNHTFSFYYFFFWTCFGINFVARFLCETSSDPQNIENQREVRVQTQRQ